MRVLSLFAGVGMFDYAWRKLGWETVAFAEMDKFCQRVLNKHYPGVPIYDDVREVTYDRLKEDGVVANTQSIGNSQFRQTHNGTHRGGQEGAGRIDKLCGIRRGQDSITSIGATGIDVICGGFPCQDLSVAGKQAGINGERSGLWSEFARIIGEFRPRYAIIENVPALLTGDGGRWFDRILIDLAEIGFDAEWHVIPAGNPDGLSAGAPHRRERVWIVAHPRHPEPQGRDETQADNEGCSGEGIQTGRESAPSCDAADTMRERSQGSVSESVQGEAGEPVRYCNTGREENVGNTQRIRQPRQGQPVNSSNQAQEREGQTDKPIHVGERGIRPTEPTMGLLANGIATGLSRSRWLPEPGIGRVATGVPDRVNKLKALGNGLVWQIPYAIGRAIMEQTNV